jgi:hypothetical protein
MSSSKRIALTRNLGRHLTELSRVLRRDIRCEDLMSVEETERILYRSKATPRAAGWKLTVPFEEKGLPWFLALIRALESAHPGRVLLWTPLASACGLPKSVALAEIDFGFSFDLNPEGILEVLTEDLENRLILDYAMEGNRAMLEVEVSGLHWAGVSPGRR